MIPESNNQTFLIELFSNISALNIEILLDFEGLILTTESKNIIQNLKNYGIMNFLRILVLNIKKFNKSNKIHPNK